MKTAFVIFETDNYTENQDKSIICVCSTREKADKALNLLKEKNKDFEFLSYSYEEVNFDFISIYL